MPGIVKKKGTLTQISADNLSANSLFGFVEGFSVTYFCRLCVTSKQEAQHIFKESFLQLRTKQSYEENSEEAGAQNNESHVFGVKQKQC